MAACPARAVTPPAQSLAALAAGKGGNITLSLPAAHCAACISTVEATLLAEPGVKAARLNLTQRRVLVKAAPDVQTAQRIAALLRAGYEAFEMDENHLSTTQTQRASRDLAMRLGVAFFAMMNVMLLSVAVWSGGDGATRDMFHWISALIASPTVAFSGRPFFASAALSLRAGRLGVDVPISLTLILATGISLFETLNGGITPILMRPSCCAFFGCWGGIEMIRPIAKVALGDTLRMRAGGRVPVDGVVVAGTSEMDRSLLTGESLPAFAGPGMRVLAGCVNLTGLLDIQAQAVGRDSALHRMADLLAAAEGAKTRYTSLAERAASWYSPLVHLLSFSAFGFWL